MAQPFDISKLRKTIDKSIQGLSYGFNDPTTWLDTGCYAMNYLICDDFYGGIPLEGKITMFAGDSGSGKSYIASANIIKDCQKKGVYPILIDTENALDQKWLEDLGVDTDKSMMEKVTAAKVDDVAALVTAIIEMYKKDNDELPYEKRAKVLIVIDSLGMLISDVQKNQFEAGNLVGDFGSKAKALTALLRVSMAKIASQPIGILTTNHIMDSTDQYQPDKISGGNMVEFATSVIVQMNKWLLKEDEHGTKLTDGQVAGIRSTCVIRKSRYAKPFEKVKIDIPYTQGMDRYSGLFELFEKKGLLTKEGNRYVYISFETGEVLKDFRKKYKSNGWLDIIMKEKPLWENKSVVAGVDETEGLTAEELTEFNKLEIGE